MADQEYNARPYQGLITNFQLDHERCNIFAGMGLGKTVSTFTACQAKVLAGQSDPILVLAPLRVAKSTWPNEVRKWKHLSGLDVMPIVGSEAERKLALRHDVPVHTCNYDNLPWLVEHYGSRWPYRTVIADECTRLKGFRLKQGGARAAALGKVAFQYAKEYIGLTGTPAPNGLADLWGQMWFVDRGQRLGRTYEAFKNRWFQRSNDGYGVDPLPFAQEQIQAAISDVCLTIRSEDWFDLDAPIVNNIYVDLPVKARVHYRELEKQMLTEINDRQVTAVNAAARTNKCLQLCLAEGTEVLSEKGWVRIENFDPATRLWDGQEWVYARKLLAQGVQETIICWGVRMTPGHLVLTKKGWRTAKDVSDGESGKRYDRSSFWIPDSYQTAHPDNQRSCDLALQMCVRQRGSTDRYEPEKHRSRPEKILRVPPRGDADRSVGHPRYDKPSRVPHLGRLETALLEPKKQRLEKLRGPGHYRVRSLAAFVRKLLGRYGPFLVHRSLHRQNGQRQGLFSRELQVDNCTPAVEQQKAEHNSLHAPREDDRRSGRRLIRPEADNAVQEVGERVGPPPRRDNSSAVEKQTFDIADAGPRNQFVVRPAGGGEPFIVHNCNGAVYLDPDADADTHPRSKEWREVHDAKLQALESIIEEANGMPVLVSYEFKSDVARIRKAFPKARMLDDNPETENEWNAGKIPILLAHPKSAGHGLNLQYGGNILVFFGHNWNLEEYQQIIERIGPVRQMQAGLNRPVYIHHIIARDTVDELVMARRETKASVQDILLEALKHKGYK